MNVLVAGGAGYVGSHVAKRLIEAGHNTVLLDNLERGHEEVAAILDAPLVVADLHDQAAVENALREHRIDGVMHFAAYAFVGESVAEPLAYYRNNVSATISLLQAMRVTGVSRLVFSSTCAVYGEPNFLPVHEGLPKKPVSPYGRTKLVVEQMLRDHAEADPNFSYAALRYFNAAGCAMDGSLGEDHDPETHLIPLVLRAALGFGQPLRVFGTDYPTVDGTAVRDYIHVDDLADAHAQAIAVLSPGERMECNLGTGRGFTVKEIIRVAERVAGRPVPTEWVERRAGDAPILYADVTKATHVLGWRARITDPDSIIGSAHEWIAAHPAGYGSKR